MKKLYPIVLLLIFGLMIPGDIYGEGDDKNPPVILNDVSETEPNDACEEANWIDLGDRVFCAYLDWFYYTDWYDHFRFEILIEQEIVIETHAPGPEECQDSEIFDTFLILFNEDCSYQFFYDDNGGEDGYSKIQAVLQPGVYNIMVGPAFDGYYGYYHLTLDSIENVPTLSEWGMIILALSLLAIGTVAVVRKRKSALSKAG